MYDDVLELLIALVSIDSVNPDLVPGGAGEQAVAEYIAEWSARAGLETEMVEVTPGRPNVLVTARGTGGGRSLMLNGHTDVVGVEQYHNPFIPVVTADRVSGRGVLDTKVGLAAALVIAKHVAAVGLRGDVVVAAVVDEECGSKGTDSLIASGLRTDAAIVLEPTELTIVHAHRGWAWGRITVHGHAAHGSRPDLGVDAIVHAAPVLAGLGELQEQLSTNPDPLTGPSSIHAGLINGGAEMSTYPALVEIDIERRNKPGEDASTLAAELTALAALVRPPATATTEATFGRSAMMVDPDQPIVLALAAAGPDLAIGAAQFWTDAALLAEAGIPSVVFGPGGGGIHETEEWLDLASMRTFIRVLDEAVFDFCR
ncbi:MAG: ArgE/DapE family deacylase [Ilumatobacteraceae bacterium]